MLSYYGTSQCTVADNGSLESAAVNETSTSSVQVVNDDCVTPSFTLRQPEDNQLLAVDDGIATDGSNDSQQQQHRSPFAPSMYYCRGGLSTVNASLSNLGN